MATLLFPSMVLFACSFQERLLYYPEQHLPDDSQLARLGMHFWPHGRQGYRGFIGSPPTGQSRGTVIVFHGNAATAAERGYYLEPLRSLGYRVLLAEYPGYGGRKGKLGEEEFVRDARETIRLAAEQYQGPIYLLGESLGCAVAAAAVREAGVTVEGLILVTPWDTLEAVAKETFPWLPVRLFLTDRFDTVANIKKFRGSIMVVAAEHDEIIPPHHARTLYQSFAGRKQIRIIPGAGHNDWNTRVTTDSWSEIMAFVTEGPAHTAPGAASARPVVSH